MGEEAGRKFLGSSPARRKELSVGEQWTVGDIVYTSGPVSRLNLDRKRAASLNLGQKSVTRVDSFTRVYLGILL